MKLVGAPCPGWCSLAINKEQVWFSAFSNPHRFLWNGHVEEALPAIWVRTLVKEKVGSVRNDETFLGSNPRDFFNHISSIRAVVRSVGCVCCRGQRCIIFYFWKFMHWFEVIRVFSGHWDLGELKFPPKIDFWVFYSKFRNEHVSNHCSFIHHSKISQKLTVNVT